MPIKNYCRKQGCIELLDQGIYFCKKHEAIRLDEKQKRLFETNKEAHDDHRFYNSENWKRLRRMKLYKNPLCEWCNKVANVVDHIKRLREGGSRNDLLNLQSLCSSCHNKKRGQESHGGGGGR